MSNWAYHTLQLRDQLSQNENSGRKYLLDNLTARLEAIAKLRGTDNIFLYGSAFLQKPHIPLELTMMVQEDINGIMSALYGMNIVKDKKHENKLIIVLHTSGGDGYAVNSIVEYLQNKFEYIEVIVPCVAMSAGTMLSLSGDCVIMGKHSQLGPIDPQLPLNGEYVAANDVIKEFNKAEKEISTNPNLSLLWQPILEHIRPGFIGKCKQELKLSEETLKRSLIERNLIVKGNSDPEKREEVAEDLAKYLNGNYGDDAAVDKQIRVHAQGIGIDDLKQKCSPNDLNIKPLESNQKLQDEVMSAYHLMTILFEFSPITKIIHSPNMAIAGWSKEFHDPN